MIRLESCVGALLLLFANTVSVIGATIVPGRTWWYVSSNDIYSFPPPAELLEHRDDVFGLKLGSEADQSEDGWVPCYATDCNGVHLYGEAIAQLREDEGKIWMIPNLHLQELAENPAAVQGIRPLFEMFLGFANGRSYEAGGELFWTDAPEGTPYLIYDFNYVVGDRYVWPWSGYCVVPGEEELKFMDEEYLEPGFPVKSVTETETDARIFEICQLLKGGNMDDAATITATGIVREGIGIIDLSPAYPLWMGFWICPASFDIARVSGISVNEPNCPELVSVKDADGTCVYGDAEFDPVALGVVEVSTTYYDSSAVYDLQGRKVKNPERGLYVRGGKKVVVRR